MDSFITTSGWGFENEHDEMTWFTHRLWISTTNRWERNAEQALVNQRPYISRINLSVQTVDVIDGLLW